MKRKATAIWQGTGKEGKGNVTSQSGTVKASLFTSASRFEEPNTGTNPEELIAAAHASCFSMKLAYVLKDAGFVADMIETTSVVEILEGTITSSRLTLNAKIPDITEEKFQEAANYTKDNCPVSKALKLEITLEAQLL